MVSLGSGDGEMILKGKSNDPVPVEQRLQLGLAVLAHELTVADSARRHGVWTALIKRCRNGFIDAAKAAREDRMPVKAGVIERRQRADIQELKLALVAATVQLRIWQNSASFRCGHPVASGRRVVGWPAT